MTEQTPSGDRPPEAEPTRPRPGSDGADDPAGVDDSAGADDLGGPGAALGSGVEDALTGEQPREDDEGKSSTSPEPTG